MKRSVYLDNSATTPVSKDVFNAMKPYFVESFGNPSAMYEIGRKNKDAIENSRNKIANLINANKSEIIFTSGGTESDNLAILGIARANRDIGNHIIVSSIEHKAIIDPCKKLSKEGFEITYLKVDSNGNISLEDLEKNIRHDTILVSIMSANNEIGTIAQIERISQIIKNKNKKTIFHTDACQYAPWYKIDVLKMGVDSLTASSSKIYGPKGVGFLYLKTGIKIEPIIFGGGQERNIRSGTENVAGIVGMTKALELISKKHKDIKKVSKLRDYLFSEITKNIQGVHLNGSLENRLPNNLNVSFEGVEGESLVLMLDNSGIFVSTGSACSSSDLNPSHVLLAIGTPIELAHCSIRFSLGYDTKKSDIDYAVSCLTKSVEKIRKMSSLK